MTFRRYTFKLYPTPAQASALRQQSVMMAHLWNALLQRQEDIYRSKRGQRGVMHADGKSRLSYQDMCKEITATIASLRVVADRDIPKSLLEMPSMPSSTLQKLRTILSEFLGVDESDIAPGSDLLDLGVDSLDKVELTFAIEQEFDIEITQDEVEDIHTVGDIISLVDNIKRDAA